jgi:hypothetical protein
MCFERETQVKNFTCWFKAKRKLKELCSFSNKTPTVCIEAYLKVKHEGGQKNLLNFHMQTLKEFTTIPLRKNEWI